MLAETSKSAPLAAGLAALQRTHEVYRRARDLQGSADTHTTSGSSRTAPLANSTPPNRSTPARNQAEKDLASSVRQLRSAQASHQLASQQAAATKKRLEASVREAREEAAQSAAQLQEELRQERSKRAKQMAAKQELEMQLTTLEQRLQTQEAASKKVTHPAITPTPFRTLTE